MSSILKALKKVENDKRSCKPDQLGVDARILLDGSSARFSRTAVSLLAFSLFVCGSGATYYVMKHAATDAVIPQQTLTYRPESHSQPPVPAALPAVLKDGTQQRTSPVQSPPSSAPVSGVPKHSPNNSIISLRPPIPVQMLETAPVPESRPNASTTTVIRPVLTINGIAFQDGGSDNMAVINGATVSNGAVIEGVRVEDIQKDRVWFSQGAEKFEIILNKSNR